MGAARIAALSAVAAGLALLSCVAPPLTSPAAQVTREVPIPVRQNLKNKVDILFMVDNSASMSSMQDQLKNRFPQFLKVFSDLAAQGTYADLQIGVVTSDYGAGATGASGCTPSGPSGGGQQGRLQALGVAAAPSCEPPVGAHFIKYAFTADGSNPNNLPPGQNLVQTFTCMASVGDSGCGFEAPLESTYAALRTSDPANAGFLRPDALLAVVYVTNEDDASAPPDTDVFDVNKTAEYGFEDSYSRQTRFAIVCCPPGRTSCADGEKTFPPYADSGGPLYGCVAAPNPDGHGPGKQYDVSRYVDFFTKPAVNGGVKVDPRDVVLVAIDAPADPVQVILSNPDTSGGQAYVQCPQVNETSTQPCVPVLQHSCTNPSDPNFFGDPAVRLNAVVDSVQHHAVSSICENDFSSALQNLAELIVSSLPAGCIPGRIPTNPDGSFPRHGDTPDGAIQADCVVQDVTTLPDGSVNVNPIAACQCAADAASSGRCSEPAYPCWRIEPDPKECSKQSPQAIGLSVDRHGTPAPANTIAQVHCATEP